MRLLTKLIFSITAAIVIAQQASAGLIINELDSDTPGTDTLEYLELHGDPNFSLNGYSLVLFNGNGDVSYGAFDLDGFSTDANGFFLYGTALVPNRNATFPAASDNLQNGADAVALYLGDATSFPNGTVPTTTNLVDALVYDTADADDTGLLTGLGQSTQYDEGGADGNSTIRSISRVPNGMGGAFTPTTNQTPGFSNDIIVPEPASVALFTLAGIILLSIRRSSGR